MRTVTILQTMLWLSLVAVTQEGRQGQIPGLLRGEWKELARCVVEELEESRRRGLRVSSPSSWRVALASAETSSAVEQVGEDPGLVLGCEDFETFARYPGGNSRWVSESGVG